jgi:hypothetical protein
LATVRFTDGATGKEMHSELIANYLETNYSDFWFQMAFIRLLRNINMEAIFKIMVLLLL